VAVFKLAALTRATTSTFGEAEHIGTVAVELLRLKDLLYLELVPRVEGMKSSN
jgi:hypothetical protein